MVAAVCAACIKSGLGSSISALTGDGRGICGTMLSPGPCIKPMTGWPCPPMAMPIGPIIGGRMPIWFTPIIGCAPGISAGCPHPGGIIGNGGIGGVPCICGICIRAGVSPAVDGMFVASCLPFGGAPGGGGGGGPINAPPCASAFCDAPSRPAPIGPWRLSMASRPHPPPSPVGVCGVPHRPPSVTGAVRAPHPRPFCAVFDAVPHPPPVTAGCVDDGAPHPSPAVLDVRF